MFYRVSGSNGMEHPAPFKVQKDREISSHFSLTDHNVAPATTTSYTTAIMSGKAYFLYFLATNFMIGNMVYV